MEQRKENWLLKKINESIEKNGRVDEECLKLIYTQTSYRNEFLEMLDKIKTTDSVSAYLYMKEKNECTELLETFENRQKVKDYLYMTRQIELVDEVIDKIRNNGWCHHILVENGKNYRCVRCGVTVDSDLNCNDYVVTDSLDYDEARILYEFVVNNNELSNVDDIINEIILARSEQKVKAKRYYL